MNAGWVSNHRVRAPLAIGPVLDESGDGVISSASATMTGSLACDPEVVLIPRRDQNPDRGVRCRLHALGRRHWPHDPAASDVCKYGDVVVTLKHAAVVALVVLLVVIGVPVLVPGMSGAMGSGCDPALAGPLCGLAVVFSGFVLAITLMARRFRFCRVELLLFLRAVSLDRPPQVA